MRSSSLLILLVGVGYAAAAAASANTDAGADVDKNRKRVAGADFKGDANFNSGVAQGGNLDFAKTRGKKGREDVHAMGRQGKALRGVSSNANDQSDQKIATGYMSEGKNNMIVTSERKSDRGRKGNGALGIKPSVDGNTVPIRAVGPNGKQARGEATQDKRTKQQNFESRAVKAKVKPTRRQKDNEDGTIEVEGDRNSPYQYKVVCDGSSDNKCEETLTGRDGTILYCEGSQPGRRPRQRAPGLTSCKKNRGRGVGAKTDSDGNTETIYKGITFSKADCDKKTVKGKPSYNCKVSKGLFSSSAGGMEAQSSGTCYTPKRRGDKEIKISNAKYIRDPKSNGGTRDYNALDCFTMQGDLTFVNFNRAELVGIMSRIGLQFHANINPIGKLSCADEHTCPATGKETECYYCDLCNQKRRDPSKSGVMGSIKELPCDQDASEKRRFSARLCPPKEAEESVCPTFTKSLNSGYLQKKADLDSRVEVYLRGQSEPTDAQVDAEYARLNYFAKLALRAKVALNKASTAVTETDVKMAFIADKKAKGEMIGCNTYTNDYGIGQNSGQAKSVDALFAGVDIAKGRGANFIRTQKECEAVEKARKEFYNVN